MDMSTQSTSCNCDVGPEETVLKYRSTYIYHGQVNKNGQPHGKGVLHYFDGVYKGEFQNGQMTGQGYRRYLNSNSYIGHFEHGERSGRGRLIEADGSRYEGPFVNSLKHGPNAVVTVPDGTRTTALFQNNHQVDGL
eukprot:TRINITY_DN12290_c0_g1_i1.p4 TRINITY_DN12290_c0_g1~~TRINITY_DN12290_c0_g1_i1.p4  ORF type:complete len:136 (+),score=4.43 TRINITY_DN12290_c0_g1_i1:2378-2785(+)